VTQTLGGDSKPLTIKGQETLALSIPLNLIWKDGCCNATHLQFNGNFIVDFYLWTKLCCLYVLLCFNLIG